MNSVSKTKGIPNPKSAANACDSNPYEPPRSRQICKQDAASHSHDCKNTSGHKKNVCRRFDAGRKIGSWLSGVLDEPRHNEEVHHDRKAEGVWIKRDVHC